MKHLLLNAILLVFFTTSFTTSGQTYKAFYGDIVSNVSSTNILNDLTTFENFGIKDVGSTALTNAENWIISRYQTLGYTNVATQSFTYSAGTSNNIIVTKTGTLYPNTYVIIDAHYDTINGPGTNDNGSGTVLLMEIARLLKDVDTEYSIKFIHFSGEEDGLIGSNYYVNNTVNPQNLDIKVVFNIDEVGGISGQTNDTIVCEEDRSNPPANNSQSSTMTAILATTIGLYSNLNTEISFAYASDYIPFENNGEIITGLYEKNETPYAHTANDLLVNMDPNYVFEVTKGSLGALMEFAGAFDTLGIDAQTLESEISMYPNPSNGNINIAFKSNFDGNTTLFTLYDVLGKQVFQQNLIQQNTSVNLQALNKGMYMAVFQSGHTKTVKKLVLN
ncbi:M20/M25/M40 family metallo-hydrolase [Ichthyenterobacterium magnum]|uniref:Putative secreted protein (Por secretion system target) n=1 Tax=Ichthyenterobacterium magnum TaxID=1230530 RepID=A0A420DF73_9FLAO|nr:M20/M25/M40 family metallo-hydrolase [Ichthyenterobacterium magnum]RKE90922.1 putative secreted protein (Por secretion system target) [Ichthyenterobacterium magnum]